MTKILLSGRPLELTFITGQYFTQDDDGELVTKGPGGGGGGAGDGGRGRLNSTPARAPQHPGVAALAGRGAAGGGRTPHPEEQSPQVTWEAQSDAEPSPAVLQQQQQQQQQEAGAAATAAAAAAGDPPKHPAARRTLKHADTAPSLPEMKRIEAEAEPVVSVATPAARGSGGGAAEDGEEDAAANPYATPSPYSFSQDEMPSSTGSRGAFQDGSGSEDEDEEE